MNFVQQISNFSDYFDRKLKPKLKEYVFQPRRKQSENTLWTNNNAESLNNILKLSVDWKPKHTADLINKIHGITELHFMDYRSALHGTYRLTSAYQQYKVNDAVWRCKSENEKNVIFNNFMADKKKTIKSDYITSKDRKYTVSTKAKGTAKKPHQTKRPCNVRTRKR